MDVLNYIMKEHDRLKETIEEIDTAVGKSKKDIFRELYTETHGHNMAEEEVVFPILKDKNDEGTFEVVLKMIERHILESYQFSTLEKTSVENEAWAAKFCVLKELLYYHMNKEEEEFMVLARRTMSKETMVEIMDKFETVLEEKRRKRKRIMVQIGDYPIFRVISGSL